MRVFFFVPAKVVAIFAGVSGVFFAAIFMAALVGSLMAQSFHWSGLLVVLACHSLSNK